MKLNLEFYKEEEEKITEKEEKIIDIISDIISKMNEENLNEKLDSNLDKILYFSDLRTNIISWYPFKQDCTILEYGANLGEITEKLCEVASNVTSIETSKAKAEAIAKRHENKENLEMIAGKLRDIHLQEKFDYIVCIGAIDKEKNAKELVSKLMNYLKEDGKLLIATDNKFGIKFWTGKRAQENANRFETITKNTNNLSITKIEETLNEQNLKYKIYYPLPDYKLTNVIFTDNSLPTLDGINRDLQYYEENIPVSIFSEKEALIQIIKQDKSQFKHFASSYFIEIGKELQENNIKYVSFGNMRKEQYRLRTIVEEENVYKYPVNEYSKEHLESIRKNLESIEKANIKTLDRYEDGRIISKFVDGVTFDKVIVEAFEKEGLDKAISLIKGFEAFLKERMKPSETDKNVFDRYGISYDKELIKQMHFIKKGLWDLIPQNCFYIDNEFYFYDQEWFEDNIPLEYITFRTVLYLSELVRRIDINTLYEKLGLTQFVELFSELDQKIQEQIRDEISWEIYSKNVVTIDELEHKYLTYNHVVNCNNILEQELNQKNIEIQHLKEELDKIKKEQEDIINSTSWKVTQPLRDISSKLNKK